MSDEILRTIQFYQIQWTEEDSDDEEKIVTKDQNFLESILNENMNKLHSYGDDYSVTLERSSSKIPVEGFFGQLSKIRTTAFPQKYIISELKPESLGLGDDEGLYEPCHFAIFEGQILICEFNFNGPRISALKAVLNNYLKENPVDNVKEILISPILKNDPIKSINEFHEIKRMEFVVATDYARKLKDEDGKFRSMFSSEEFVESMLLHLSFSLGRFKQDDSTSKFDKLVTIAKNLIQREEFPEGIQALRVHGRKVGLDELISENLAEQLFKTKRKIAKLNSETRAVDPDEMHNELASLYITNKEDLKRFIQEED